MVALGEIGLDYHYDDMAPKKYSAIFFERQLLLAKKKGFACFWFMTATRTATPWSCCAAQAVWCGALLFRKCGDDARV